MKRALIATLFNEANNIAKWWGCIGSQTVLPDELVIVDSGAATSPRAATAPSS